MSDYADMTLEEMENLHDRTVVEAANTAERVAALKEELKSLQDFGREQALEGLRAAIGRKYMDARSARTLPDEMLGDD